MKTDVLRLRVILLVHVPGDLFKFRTKILGFLNAGSFCKSCVNIARQNFRNFNHKSLFICRHSFAMGKWSLN